MKDGAHTAATCTASARRRSRHAGRALGACL